MRQFNQMYHRDLNTLQNQSKTKAAYVKVFGMIKRSFSLYDIIQQKVRHKLDTTF